MLKTGNIPTIFKKQDQYFLSGNTQKIEFRQQKLKQLKQLIIEKESEIAEALNKDLGKCHFESYLSEIRIIKKDIDNTINNLKKWIKPRYVSTPIEQFPATALIQPQPKGVILIISPWNYPFSLAIMPLIGAIAAGNCAIIKPSELTPNTSKVIAKIINNYFDDNYIKVIEGGKDISQKLLKENFDHIFFTGSSSIGKIVMEAAAKHLTPVTLELGGKSPCIVDKNINVKETAKRIVWGKFLNAGQSCIAPDYLLVNQPIKSQLLEGIKEAIKTFYGEEPFHSPDYGRIINEYHFKRLSALLPQDNIIVGGQLIPQENYISPTVIDHISPNSPIMEDEIFGPILPIFDYSEIEEAIAFINQRPKPLAIYLFSNDKKQQKKILENTRSGSVGINDTVMQYGVLSLPFGGVGNSGMGAYHGKASFDTFSHYKSVLKRSFWFETNLRFPPYQGKLKWVKRLLG
ncbi:aldehyde dehydrogenase [Crocosphaera chwakensis]|uniref:Aldehyde dehydrogenase n=1 Tax=Crocosphaera chwakensis CCY0110 TaxID=391612 RepID=A3IQI2_9CHRO|nr:aldehyde dehydrogenase [Crocosphaera chwakensis]EAZ91257.1 Aldehyde dehydrogenase [Crocosphaera chwakensis CCY0110]